MEPTGYHLIVDQLTKNIVNHGWGELTFKVSSMKDFKVHVIVTSGLSHHFIIEKDILQDKNIL